MESCYLPRSSQTPSRTEGHRSLLVILMPGVCQWLHFGFGVFSRSRASSRTVALSLYAQHERGTGTSLRCVPAEASRGTKSLH